MQKQTIEQFCASVLNIDITNVTTTGWLQACCPIHGERRPSFGILKEYPHISHCFSCGWKGSLPYLTAKVLKIPLSAARELVERRLVISFESPDMVQRDHTVSDAVAQMYELSLDKKVPSAYLRYRGISKVIAKIWGFGYDDLGSAVTVPCTSTTTADVIGHLHIQFRGGFDDNRKLLFCGDGSGAVLVPKNYRKFKHAIVTEGALDGARASQLLWSRKEFADCCPVALHGAFASDRQISFIRQYDQIILALDHDEAGRRGRDRLVQALKDRPKVFDLCYPDERKDLGELQPEDNVFKKLQI